MKLQRISKAGGRNQEPPPAVSALFDCALNIKVQRELVRMRPQPDWINLAFAFVTDPRLEHVGREHVSLEQEVMIALQRIERLIQRTRH